ncbi:MAG: metalloregulator ArsR/SmtB family transcription factor [Lactobacillus sp.]|jgi:ArsR family transcriptional regulator|nr:metalloregulator ArsR/SmtB family transcription factor [Lactobacillus sp.]
MDKQLPIPIMKKAVKGIGYISHPLRLRILEYLDVYGLSSVSTITKGLGEDQIMVSQSLKKLRDANLVKTKRKGIFIYYDINEEYPASIFDCMRKLFGYMTEQMKFLKDGYKEILPNDYTTMVANRIKLFANFDKMRILEYLIINEECCVSEIVKGIGSDQLKVSQYLKRLRDDGFVVARRDGRFMCYSITKGVHKSSIQCIHKRYDSLKNKSDF